MLIGFINEAAAGTVHRLYRVVGIVEAGEIHILFVIVPVAALMPKLFIENYRRLDFLVAVSVVNGPPEFDYRIPDNHSLWRA